MSIYLSYFSRKKDIRYVNAKKLIGVMKIVCVKPLQSLFSVILKKRDHIEFCPLSFSGEGQILINADFLISDHSYEKLKRESEKKASLGGNQRGKNG